jgi:hypothetical protein
MIFRSEVYEEYLKWWRYWNSKIPQKCELIERLPSTRGRQSRVQSISGTECNEQPINTRKLKGTRKQRECLAVAIQDSGTNIDPAVRWIGGWED